MKTQIAFAIILAAFSLALSGCEVRTEPVGSGAAQQQINEETKPTTAKADRRDIVGYRLMSGRVYTPPKASAEVLATAAAPVETVDVKVGESVSRGDVLVTLATGQKENYQQAKSTYDAARAAYNQALAQYEQPVKDVQRQLDQARATERTVRETTPPGGDATALQQAVATRQTLQDQLKVVRAQATSNELQYKTQLDQARSALNTAISGMKNAIITAPISGTVVSLSVAPGQTLNGRTVVATIVDLAALKVQSDVHPSDAPYVKEGTDVVIVFTDHSDRKFDGEVTMLDALPTDQEGKAHYEATIDFANTDGMIKPNSTVRSVGVVVGHRRGVIAVPLDAVAKDSTGKPIVQVMEGDAWKANVVELGLSDGVFVEVKDGVKDGDSVQVIPGQGQWLVGSNLTTSS